MRDRRLQRIEAVVERQQRMPPEGDDDGLLLDRQNGGLRLLSGPVGRSATDVRFLHLATVFWLMP